MRGSFQVLGVAVASLAAAASVSAVDLSQPCAVPCPSGTVDVVVTLRAKPASDDNGFLKGKYAREFFDDAMGKEDVENYPRFGGDDDSPLMNIESAQDLRQKLIGISNSKDAAGRCQRIKFLGIASHGNLGYVHFVNGGLDVNSVQSALGGLDCAMSNDARVFFEGCNVARGCRGDDFLMGVAGQLLKRGGGRVRGYTNYVVASPLNDPRSIAPRNNTQILTVGAGLSNPTWDDGNGDGRDNNRKDCSDRIDDAESAMTAMRVNLEPCLDPHNGREDIVRYPKIAERARAGLTEVTRVMSELKAARASEAGRRTDRTSFEPADLKSGQSFYNAFNDYWAVAGRYDGLSCVGCSNGGCHSQPTYEPKIDLRPVPDSHFGSCDPLNPMGDIHQLSVDEEQAVQEYLRGL